MIVLDLDHERGDFSEYSNGKVDANNRLSVTTNAAAIGKYGVECVLVDDGTKYYADHDFYWLEVSDWRFRVYVKLDNVSMGSGNRFRLVHTTGGNGSNLYVFIGYSSSIGFYVRAFFYYDGGGYVVSSDVPLSATGWNRIECVTQRATGASASDGRVAIEINGTQQWEQTGVDIYDRAPPDNIQVGVPRADLEAATSGTIYFDGIAIANSSATAIGDEQGGVIWYQVDANNRNCRDLRNENSSFSNTLFGWGSWWASGGVSFAADVLPKGATIHSANIIVRSQSADGAFTANIYGEDVDNGSLLSAALPSFTRTSQSVSWSENFDAANKLFQTPDLSTIVSAIVGRSGWSPGNNLTFEIDGLDNLANPFSYNDSATWAPRMRVVFSEPSSQDYPVNVSLARSLAASDGATSGVGVGTVISSSMSVSDVPQSASDVGSAVDMIASVLQEIVSGSVGASDVGIVRSGSHNVSSASEVYGSYGRLSSASSGAVSAVDVDVAQVSVALSVQQSGNGSLQMSIAVARSASATSEQSAASLVSLPIDASFSVGRDAVASSVVSAQVQRDGSVVFNGKSASSVSVSADALLALVQDAIGAISGDLSALRSSSMSTSVSSAYSADLGLLVSLAVALSAAAASDFPVSVLLSAIVGVDDGIVVDSLASVAVSRSGASYADVESAVALSLDVLSSSLVQASVTADVGGSVSVHTLYDASWSVVKGISASLEVIRQVSSSASVLSDAGVDISASTLVSVAAAVASMVDYGINVSAVRAVTMDEAGALLAMLVDVTLSDGAVYTVVLSSSGVAALVMTDQVSPVGDISVSDALAASATPADDAPVADVSDTGGGENG